MSEQPKWTPGPWDIQEYPGERFAEVWSAYGPYQRAIAKVWFGGFRDDSNNLRGQEMEAANAHLIAAAPELYKALAAYEKLDYERNHCRQCDGESAAELCAYCFPFADKARLKMRAALAKARGEV